MMLDLTNVLGLPELPAQLTKVEDALANIAAIDNAELAAPIKRILQVPGKRLRPSLVIAVANSLGSDINARIILAACTVELVHLASLVHDDIIDHADVRRGVATINSREGNDMAIVVGDYLLAKASEYAAGISAESGQLVAQTIAKLCDGQARELASKYNLDRTKLDYIKSIRGKTASLFSAACRLGAMCSNASKNQTETFANFGENFGMAYQIIDDVQDFVSTPELAGKPIGRDVREGIYTLPLLLSLKSSRITYEKLIKEKNQNKLVNSLKKHGFIEQAIREAEKYSSLSAKLLKASANKNSLLKELPTTYLNYALR